MATVDFGRYRRLVQVFWDPQPTNDTVEDQPVWCLGSSYTLGDDEESETQQNNHVENASPANGTRTPPDPISKSPPPYSIANGDGLDDGGWPQQFLEDFESKFWMTYRSDFPTIPKSRDTKSHSTLSLAMRIRNQLVDQNGFTSDTGWGCMIRSGQSLLANAISINRFGRSWRRCHPSSEEEKTIVSKFSDDPRAPYSIHSFVNHGAIACGKYPGEWFGPSATARCIQALANANEPHLRVYSTGDGPDVYEDAFMSIASPDGYSFHPTLVLVSTRLGIDKITPVYLEALVAALQMPQSVGIAGGRPSSSHYFIGAQGPFLFYLDPHHTRQALPFYEDPKRYSEADIASCHTRRLRRLHVREMDPSMLIGFLIKDKEDWLNWRRGIKHVQGKAVVSVYEHDPALQNRERQSAIDEVETISDDDDEEAGASPESR